MHAWKVDWFCWYLGNTTTHNRLVGNIVFIYFLCFHRFTIKERRFLEIQELCKPLFFIYYIHSGMEVQKMTPLRNIEMWKILFCRNVFDLKYFVSEWLMFQIIIINLIFYKLVIFLENKKNSGFFQCCLQDGFVMQHAVEVIHAKRGGVERKKW